MSVYQCKVKKGPLYSTADLERGALCSFERLKRDWALRTHHWYTETKGLYPTFVRDKFCRNISYLLLVLLLCLY